MPKGGARNRSGPQPTPGSARSDARGLRLSALPSEGFRGESPVFPLPGASDRELEVWAELWRTPQAVAWDREPWRHRIVGHYVRWSVRAEDPECSGTVLGQVHRLADQVGLTPAGLKENGWAIASDEVGAKRGEAAEESAPKAAPVRRLRAVGGDA